MKKGMVWLLAVLGFLALAGLVTAILGYYLYQYPFKQAENAMPEDGVMTLTAQADGTWLLTWPAGMNTDCYTVEILPGRAENPEEDVTPLFYEYVEEATQCVLPALPEEYCTIRIGSGKHYRVPGNEYVRLGEQPLEVRGTFSVPRLQNLEWTADPIEQTVDVSFDLGSNETCELYLYRDDQDVEVRSLDTGRTTYTFGGRGEYPLPAFSETYRFSGAICRVLPGLIIYGPETEGFLLEREDLLGTVLKLDCEEQGNNVYTLHWNETKGERYELQMRAKDEVTWKTLYTTVQGGTLEYTTDHLAPYTSYHFRVLALGGQTLPDSIFAATPDETSFTTVSSPIFCTIWPLIQLPVYSTPGGEKSVGTVAEGSTHCVLEEIGDWFGIRCGDEIGYIDSRYCMINLPEYIGDICLYNITNSYSSLYMVHEYEIPEVTDTVIVGYENVQLYNGSYLAPLLYPAAKKLEQAALSAIAEGYRIKIYDSYRPRKATLEIYDLAARILDDPIPELTYAEKLEQELEGGEGGDLPPDGGGETLPPEVTEPLPVPEETESTEATESGEEGVEGDPPAEGEEGEEGGEEEEEPRMTYRQLMLDGRYSLSNFLAYSGSNHNIGVAMDLTLVDEAGEELEMQTSIHDLSWFSEISENNENAKLLDRIMKEAGFGGLKSEWWHFQDNDAKAALKLKNLNGGVSPEGWMADDHGWRYRQGDGVYYVGCIQVIDGVTYHFDQNGYVQE